MINWHNPGTYADLLKRARSAAHLSYCPYTRCRVGAAGLFLDGVGRHAFASGSSVELAVPTLAMCAERIATFSAAASGFCKLVAMAVTRDEHEVPCGACLQVLSEFADSTSIVIVDGVGNFRLQELLPKAATLRQA